VIQEGRQIVPARPGVRQQQISGTMRRGNESAHIHLDTRQTISSQHIQRVLKASILKARRKGAKRK
jgi:hypothetical protein